MGTVFKIKVAVDHARLTTTTLDSVLERAFQTIDDLEQDMSEWIETSPISKAAANAGVKPVRINRDVARVLAMAQSISRKSNGAFDISFKPLGRLWDVKNRKKPPLQASIDSVKAFVDYTQLQLDTTRLELYLEKTGMQIGLGGIAKGYAAKAAGHVLEQNGIKNYIVNAGGDLYYSGKKGQQYWTSGIKSPEKESEPLLKFKVLKDMGVATSGEYENFFVYDGKKYHHIINPQSGYPAEGYKSVTVFSENPALADAYATAFFIIGYEKALQIVEDDQTIAFIMIDNSNELKKSTNLNNFIDVF